MYICLYTKFFSTFVKQDLPILFYTTQLNSSEMQDKLGFKIGQQDRNGEEVTTGAILYRGDSDDTPEICAYVREWGAFLGLTPELYKEYNSNGIGAIEDYEPFSLMILAHDTKNCTVNGTIETRPEILL